MTIHQQHLPTRATQLPIADSVEDLEVFGLKEGRVHRLRQGGFQAYVSDETARRVEAGVAPFLDLIAGKPNADELAAVATSGSYGDLEDRPVVDISGLAGKADVVTYETLTALGETGGGNERAEVKRLFEAGGLMPFRSLPDAESTVIPASINRTLIAGVEYERVSAEPLHDGKYRSSDRWTSEGSPDEINGGWWVDRFFATTVVNIPEEFPTLQAAIEKYSRTPVRAGAVIEIRMASGYVIQTGLSLTNGDYSKFNITSVDPTVPLSVGFNTHVFSGRNALMPVLATVIDASNQIGGVNGVSLFGGAMDVLANCGVINAHNTGLLAQGAAKVMARGTKWTGAARNGTTGAGITAWSAHVDATDGDVSGSHYYGAQAAHGGVLTFERGKANNCLRYGVRGSDAGIIDFSEGEAKDCGVYGIYAFQSSHINAPGAIATGCGTHNAVCTNGSTLNVRMATLTGAVQKGLYCVSGTVDAFSANCNNAGTDGMACEIGKINAGGATAQNCGQFGFAAIMAGEINARLGNASGSPIGFYANEAGTVNAQQGTATGCSQSGASAIRGGRVNATSATLTGAGIAGARASEGGVIAVTSANCRKGVSDDVGTSTADIQCFSGSQIVAHLSTGGANRALNALSTNGVIFG